MERIVSILILLDYLFLFRQQFWRRLRRRRFQSLFYWITYSYYYHNFTFGNKSHSFNPYFTGLPILIAKELIEIGVPALKFQSLFYWITYSYHKDRRSSLKIINRFQSLFYWITYSYPEEVEEEITLEGGFNPYFTGLPILIFKTRPPHRKRQPSFNPYFTGLPILII